VQTAAAIGLHQHAPLRHANELLEIDFGAWTGRSFVELATDADWQRFNTNRSTAVIPEGEKPAAVQARIVAAIARLAGVHAGSTIALVSHGDVLRFALLHYVGATLDDYARFDLDPASVTTLSVCADEVRLLTINASL
jgi:broad specificity phosphatase PhoE